MELNTNQTISNEINTSLKNLPNYIQTTFVEDCLRINAILNSELRNQSDFKMSINILRAILRDNKTLFGPLFQNLIKQYLSILDKENTVPEEYIFLLVDILRSKSEIKKYYKKWIYKILETLIVFSGLNMDKKNNEQINKICGYIQYWFDEYDFKDQIKYLRGGIKKAIKYFKEYNIEWDDDENKRENFLGNL